MLKLYSPSGVKAAESEMIAKKLTEIELVKRAALGVASMLDKNNSYTVFCGKGNNGADGFAIVGLLKELGVNATAVVVGDRKSEAGEYYFNALPSGVVENFSEDVFVGDVIIDCIFGIGFKGDAEGEYLKAIEFINARKKAGAKVYSVDVPSGLDAANGKISAATVLADKTFIIGYQKIGLYLADSFDCVGERVFVDIGFPQEGGEALLWEAQDFGDVLKKRPRNSNKYDYGFIGVLGGSENYSGAAKLSNIAAAACVSGAGVVRLIVPESIKDYVAPYLLESTLCTLPCEGGKLKFDDKAITGAINRLDSLAVGMGMTDGEETAKVVGFLLKNFRGNLIIDAGALNSIKSEPEVLRKTEANVIITPHSGEFARLTGVPAKDISLDPVGLAKAFAREYNIKVLLKGPSTIVTDGETVYIVDRGTAGMATAGSGDVLSGVLAALCGKGKASLKTVALAPFVCGYAAELSKESVCDISLTAGVTASYLARAIGLIHEESNP